MLLAAGEEEKVGLDREGDHWESSLLEFLVTDPAAVSGKAWQGQTNMPLSPHLLKGHGQHCQKGDATKAKQPDRRLRGRRRGRRYELHDSGPPWRVPPSMYRSQPLDRET